MVIHIGDLTSNVRLEACGCDLLSAADPAIHPSARTGGGYRSIMCSTAPGAGAEEDERLATMVGQAIEELAAIVGESSEAGTATEADLAGRLARAWALMAAADPELAARVARYFR